MARFEGLSAVVDPLRANPEFMAGWLAFAPGGDSWISRRLNLDQGRLERLLLCRSPRPSTFRNDVHDIAALVDVGPASLAAALREAAALAALSSARGVGEDVVQEPTRVAGLLAAARDTSPETIRRGSGGDAFIRRLANDIRARAPQEADQMLDVEAIVAWSVPLALVVLPELDVAAAHGWLRERGVELGFGSGGQPLRGLLLAWRGSGLIFVDGSRPEADRRFTIAHELGHFLLDYLEARGRVLRRTPDLLEVLDGHRPPSTQDRTRALLEQVKLGVHTHLLSRDPHGGAPWEVEQGEDRSSRFALELLSPWNAVRAAIRRLPDDRPWESRLAEASSILARDFKLPEDAARTRAREVLDYLGRGPTFFER